MKIVRGATIPLPAVAQLHPWERPDHPWSRIHAYYAGHFMGFMFLILTDAYSKWIESTRHLLIHLK